MQSILITACVLVIGVTGYSQDFRTRVESMKREYATINNVYIRMTIKAFETPTSSDPIYEQEASIKKKGRNYFYRFDGTEMLMNERYIIVVDESTRQIMCTTRSLKDEEKFMDPFDANLDSALKFYEEPVLISSKDNIDQYRLSPKLGEIKTMDLFINKISNLLTRIDYEYTEGHYAQIEFVIFDRHTVMPDVDFSEQKYIIKEKGNIKTSPLYSRFNLAIN